MTRHQRLEFTAAICATCLLLPTATFATSISFGGSYSYSMGADGGGFSVAPIIVDSDEPVSFPGIDTRFEGRFGSIATLKMFGAAAPGVLKGFVETTADVRGSSALNGAANANVGSLDVGFIDTLLFDSDTLPFGTPVTYEYHATLHSTLSLVGSPNCAPGAPVAGSVDLLAMGGLATVGKSACGPAMPDTQSLMTLIHTTVGAEFVINGRLRIAAGAGADVGGQLYSSSTVEASNTATFFLIPVTQGVTFTSASGASYAAPSTVPEPATFLFLVAGAIVVFTSRRCL
jgi:hypothetical protein